MEENLVPIQWRKGPDGSSPRRCIGKDLVLLRNPVPVTNRFPPFRLEHYLLIICKKGEIRGNVNLKKQEIGSRQLTLIPPGRLIQIDSISHDFRALFVVVSPAFLSKLEIKVTDVLPFRFLWRLHESPKIPLKPDDLAIAISYFNLTFNVISDLDNPFRENVAVDLIRSFFYESSYYLSKNLKEEVNSEANSRTLKRLLYLIQKHYRDHRDVTFYANELHLSPNYLYRLIKEQTGQTVKELIEEYTVSEAKALLKGTEMTIQEISDQLHFPSQSFFGKFFKRIAGVAPKYYRENFGVER